MRAVASASSLAPFAVSQSALLQVSSVKNYPYLTGRRSRSTPTSFEARTGWVRRGQGTIGLPPPHPPVRSVVHAFERLGTLREPEIVVVQGTGPVGLFSVVMAARSGAAKVIAIGAPAQRLEVAKKWGADHTISVDVPHAERVNQVKELTGGIGADLVIEGSGARSAFIEGVDLVRRGGRFLVIGQVGPDSVSPPWWAKDADIIGYIRQCIGLLQGVASWTTTARTSISTRYFARCRSTTSTQRSWRC